MHGQWEVYVRFWSEAQHAHSNPLCVPSLITHALLQAERTIDELRRELRSLQLINAELEAKNTELHLQLDIRTERETARRLEDKHRDRAGSVERKSTKMVMKLAAKPVDELPPPAPAAVVRDRSSSPQRIRGSMPMPAPMPAPPVVTTVASEESIRTSAVQRTVQLVKAIAERSLPVETRSPESIVDYRPQHEDLASSSVSVGSMSSGMAKYDRLQEMYNRVTIGSGKR